MKKLSFLLVFAVLLSSISFTSCGKYEEGPGLSVLPKKSRLQQKWRPIEYVDASGTVTTPSNDGSYVEFVKGGECKFYDGTFDAGYTGTWEFNSDKSEIVTTFTYPIIGTITSSSKIVKLKINSLGLEDENGDRTYYEYF